MPSLDTEFRYLTRNGALEAIASVPPHELSGVLRFTSPTEVSSNDVGAATSGDILDRAAGDARYAAIGSGVTSFNTRTGAVTLSSGDVTTALGFTPVTNARTIGTTAPLAGGGALSGNLTLTISAATGVAAGSMSAADKTKLDAISGTNTGDQTSVSGNAGTATALQTARTIAGNSFDGTADISINDTDLSGAAWETYTPTITAQAGTFTTVSATGRYKQIGKTVFVEIVISITLNGTAATAVKATLPVTAYAAEYILAGGERATTGNMIQGHINGPSDGTYVYIVKYDNSYPGATGYRLVLSGVYEAA